MRSLVPRIRLRIDFALQQPHTNYNTTFSIRIGSNLTSLPLWLHPVDFFSLLSSNWISFLPWYVCLFVVVVAWHKIDDQRSENAFPSWAISRRSYSYVDSMIPSISWNPNSWLVCPEFLNLPTEYPVLVLEYLPLRELYLYVLGATLKRIRRYPGIRLTYATFGEKWIKISYVPIGWCRRNARLSLVENHAEFASTIKPRHFDWSDPPRIPNAFYGCRCLMGRNSNTNLNIQSSDPICCQ